MGKSFILWTGRQGGSLTRKGRQGGSLTRNGVHNNDPKPETPRLRIEPGGGAIGAVAKEILTTEVERGETTCRARLLLTLSPSAPPWCSCKSASRGQASKTLNALALAACVQDEKGMLSRWGLAKFRGQFRRCRSTPFGRQLSPFVAGWVKALKDPCLCRSSERRRSPRQGNPLAASA